MRRIPASHYVSMPWKNGGGRTLEIARAPAEGVFDWRVSIADVASSGPFSRFDGYDRHILMLEGGGMELRGPELLKLDASFQAQSFPGEWEIDGHLTAGPVRDFNLMLRRAACTGRLESELVAAPLHLTGACLIHVAQGALAQAATHDSLWLEAGESATLIPQPQARLVLAFISQNDPSRRA